MADSAPQLNQQGPKYTAHRLSNRVVLPDPTHLREPVAKRRTKADRRLLFELGRTKGTSTRRSSHKAMGKRMFFLLSGRHNMQNSVPPPYENVLQLDEKALLLSDYRLPSFREGFSEWVQDISHMNPMQIEIALDKVSSWRENVGCQLPSIVTLLKGQCY